MKKVSLLTFKGLEESALFNVTGGAEVQTTVTGSSVPSHNGKADRLDEATAGTSTWDMPEHSYVNGTEVDYWRAS